MTLLKVNNFYNGDDKGYSASVVESNGNFVSDFINNLEMIQLSLSLIGREVTKVSPKIVFTGTWNGQ